MKNRIYVKDLFCFENASKAERKNKLISPDQYFDLDKLPCQSLKDEMGEYILHRGEVLKLGSIRAEFWPYNTMCRFIKDRFPKLVSFRDESLEHMEHQLRIWLVKKGYSVTSTRYRKQFGKEEVKASPIILYLRRVFAYFEPECDLPEEERDVWRIKYLPFPVRNLPSNPLRSINFTVIPQTGIREQTKKAALIGLSYQAARTVSQQVAAMKRFSQYISRKYEKIQELTQINRDVLEDYLIYLNTEVDNKKSFRSELFSLKSILEQVGLLEENRMLCNLFLADDIHKGGERPVYKDYADDELVRLNAAIVQMDAQVARVLIIDQMLMNRISETLMLEQDCIIHRDGHTMIKIFMIKPMRITYKPANDDVVNLIQKAIEYTNDKYGKRKYVFVSEDNPDEPMRYAKIQYQLMCMVQENNLRDNRGELFGVGTHTFRNSAGRRLTEMHVDDMTIAKLLGHADTNTVRHYRKFGNEALANETRAMRNSMDDILEDITKEW